MSATKIEWTEHTWNPVRAHGEAIAVRMGGVEHRHGWTCVKVSPGCANCYAEKVNRRFGPGQAYTEHGMKAVQTYLDDEVLREPLRWKKSRMVFVCSMTDFFGEWVTDEMLDKIFAVMALCPQHTFQVLTKRAERMEQYLQLFESRMRGPQGWWTHIPSDLRKQIENLNIKWPLQNVWLGVSVEDQQRADERIPHLLRCPAAVRWLSVEPLLGPVDLKMYMSGEKTPSNEEPFCERQDLLHWVVVGGESGPGARLCNVEWIRDIVRQCKEAGVPCFVKQDSGQRPGLQGRIPSELWIKEFPNAI